MLAFLIGLWVGGAVGMGIMCLLWASRDGDAVSHEEKNRNSL